MATKILQMNRLCTSRWIRVLLGAALLLLSCNESKQEVFPDSQRPFAIVLGIAQDAGFPQAGCLKDCCRKVWLQPAMRQMVSCLGIVDPLSKACWLIDATPDFKDQLKLLTEAGAGFSLHGILLTHAHIGHYTGLMHLGREAMGADGVPVFAMPRMRAFLKSNGPWNQLLRLGNIKVESLKADSMIQLNDRIRIVPFEVPHRDEYSETVGFRLIGPEKQLLYIPDIDKWQKWDRDIVEQVKAVDYAFVDGTFFQNGEIPGRDMSEIPHPFVEESISLFVKYDKAIRQKIHFIHFNHTNPIMDAGSTQRARLLKEGFRVAEQEMLVGL